MVRRKFKQDSWMTNNFSLSSEEVLGLEAVGEVTESGSVQLDIDKCSKKAGRCRKTYICERVVDAGFDGDR